MLGVGVDVVAAADNVAGVQLVGRLAGAVEGVHHGAAGNAALKTAAGLGAHAVGTAGQTNSGTIKHGALEHHVGGAFDDLALFAAHDAGKAGGALLVANDKVFGAQGVLVAVKCGQHFAFVGIDKPENLLFHLRHILSAFTIAQPLRKCQKIAKKDLLCNYFLI